MKGFVHSHTAGKWQRQGGELAVRLHSPSKGLPDPLLPASESRIKDEKASPLPPAVPSAAPASSPWVLLRGIRRRDDFCGGSDLHFYVLQGPGKCIIVSVFYYIRVS